MNSIRFRTAAAALLLGAFALAQANPAAAFIRLTRQGATGIVQAHWFDSELPLQSVIDPANKDIPAATALSVVQTSAKAWENVNTSYFTVNPTQFVAGTDSLPALVFDGQNSVFFDTTGTNFAPGGTVIAFVRSIINLVDGHTLDADMVYNDRDFFSSISSPGLTPAPPGQISIDLQAVITHEYGHYFSLDHTSVFGCTMIPFISNDISQRTLELDDRAGLSTVYAESAERGLSPDGIDFHATTGKISGTVLSGFNGSAVFGAHVEAINLAAPTPANTISAISGELTVRSGQGDYTIYGLPPGNYAVRIVPLDGINTTAADPNVGGIFNGIDINFEPEFWNGAGESGNGFQDPPNAFSAVAVGAGQTSPGIGFITNAYLGRVVIAQHGQFENFVTGGNNSYRAIRFDPPFEGPYTISSVNFPTFTFNGVPAVFPTARLCPMNPVTGGPDLANPLFSAAPLVASPNGNNIIPLNLQITQPNQTFFWVLQFPAQGGPGFPNNFPFVRMDFTSLDRGLFANTYSVTLGGTPAILIDRNIVVDMTCQVADAEVPLQAPRGLGANRRATMTEFSYLPPPDVRADGFNAAPHSLSNVVLIQRSPFAYADRDTAGAGATTMRLEPSPPSTPPATIWAAQAIDKNGHRSLQSNVTILALNEDSKEPNGRLNEAFSLSTPANDSTVTYSPAGDQDYYSILAKPGDVIEARASATFQDGFSNTDLIMYLFDNSGDLLVMNDDFSGLNPKITFTVPPSPGNSGNKTARKFTILVTDFFSSAEIPASPVVRVPQSYHIRLSVTIPPGAAAQLAGRMINPDQFFFANSGPNPANPIAKFVFIVPRSAVSAAVRVNIFDVNGRLVRTLVDRNVEAGPHTAIWDGKDQAGRGVASGTYFARMESGKWKQDTRVTILK